ncbi:MAG TPA: ATP-binding cassette domain-containing protein, partial [Alphaproteobacteria bacterium]|nr:ATP-binding cassette domain-containing protein [Alphaproteobacteria bacterium]
MNNNNNSNSGPVLNATGVVKSYGARKALDAVDITIQPGEFVVLLGPNGAGKTTLFQLLTGLFTPG